MCPSACFRRRLLLAAAMAAVFLVSHPPAAYATDDITLWEQGCARVEAGDLAGARDCFTQLVGQYPGSPKAPGAQLKLAYITMRTGPSYTEDIIAAFSLVRERYELTPEAGEALVRIGYLHSRADAAQAIGDFTSFLASYPGHALGGRVQESLGRLYLRTGDLDKAEAAFDHVAAVPGVSDTIAEEAALQSGFVKVMKFYASKEQSYLRAAMEALANFGSSSRVNVRARADLGIAECTLLLGNPVQAHEKYGTIAQTYSSHPYFHGIALYGVACCSQATGNLTEAVSDFAVFLDAQQGATLAEKDTAWKAVALVSTSANARVSVQESGSWERLPGSEIVRESLFYQCKCLYRLKQYDEAIGRLPELVSYVPEGTRLHTRAARLLERCRNAKGVR